jgi:hypothetical protein
LTENTHTTQPQLEVHDFKATGIIALRFIQLMAIGVFVVGFIWGGSDFLNSLIPANSVVTPLSVLLMLYGAIGSLVIEVAIRVVRRKK